MSIKLQLHRDYRAPRVTCHMFGPNVLKKFADDLASCFRQFYSKHGILSTESVCPSCTKGHFSGAFVRPPTITASRPDIVDGTSTTTTHVIIYRRIIRRGDQAVCCITSLTCVTAATGDLQLSNE